MSEKIKLIFGVPYPWAEEDRKGYLEVLEEYGVDTLDTGSSYPGSENYIGDAGLSAQFTIHTKAKGWVPGVQGYEKILEYAAQSLKSLKVDSVDTYYLHSPDPATPLSETLDAIQKLYLEGKFKKFGISNFLPGDVQAVHEYCSSHKYVLPTVYEGNYNPVGRHCEAVLFPLLRRLGISFNAYSTLAGGFLVKSPSNITNASSGRWDTSTAHGKLFVSLYNKPKLLEALKTWDDISKDSGISKADLSYRWAAWHSQLGRDTASQARERDGIVLGANGPKQLRETLKGLRAGPLPGWVVERIEGVWEAVKEEAIFDNYNADKF